MLQVKPGDKVRFISNSKNGCDLYTVIMVDADKKPYILEIRKDNRIHFVYDHQLVFANGDSLFFKCECGSRKLSQPGHSIWCPSYTSIPVILGDSKK